MGPTATSKEDNMTDLSKLEEAIATLEERDEEYSLEDLASQSVLSLAIVKNLVKKCWIEEDQLKIFNLELTEAEEAELYNA